MFFQASEGLSFSFDFDCESSLTGQRELSSYENQGLRSSQSWLIIKAAGPNSPSS